MTDPIRFKLGLAGGLITDAEGDWITYRTHVAEIARLTAERDEWRDADQAECALNARLRAECAEMRGERDAAELSRDAAHARLAEAERTIARLSGFKP